MCVSECYEAQFECQGFQLNLLGFVLLLNRPPLGLVASDKCRTKGSCGGVEKDDLFNQYNGEKSEQTAISLA